jgi:hypothetical protein
MVGETGVRETLLGETLLRASRFPGLRALAWDGEFLYASRRYELLRARIQNPSAVTWEPVSAFRPPLQRCLSTMNRLTARLFRDGFHALAILPSGALVATAPGAIVTCAPHCNEFRITHTITRGTRPLHITAVPGGTVYWGEYFDNAARDEVHIYTSSDGGQAWTIAYTFPKGSIRHVHNIVYDPWGNCLWALTGDYGDECRILRAACDFSRVEAVVQGNQQARAVALVPTAEGLYFSSDTPLESNFIYFLDRKGTLSRLAPISSSSIYGCRIGERIFFSTMVEPSKVNRDQNVRLYCGASGRDRDAKDLRKNDWQPLLAWKKDRWPMGLFQYGNAFLPDGNNTTSFLALTTVAVESEDMVTSLFVAS